MLIELTLKCNEHCTHCMVNALPTSPHMSWETLEQSVKFIRKTGSRVIVITGGEITCDPEFMEKIQYIVRETRNNKPVIILESNGTWIRSNLEYIYEWRNVSEEESENNLEIQRKIKTLLAIPNIKAMQVSTHKKFYTHYDDIVLGKNYGLFSNISNKIEVTMDWQGESTNLVYLGRAQQLLNESELKGNPPCVNTILPAKQIDKVRMQVRAPRNTTDVEVLITYLEQCRGKFCSPSIGVSGKVHVGETPQCMSFGSVYELNKLDRNEFSDAIINRINMMKFCDKCKVAKNIDISIRKHFNL